jgi:hypothetical protein
MRSLSPIEAASLVSLAGCVLAVVVPTFTRNVHASYVSEATRGVGELSAKAAARLDAARVIDALPESAPLTPTAVPRGVRVQDPPGTWAHPTWRALDFGFEREHAYAFGFDAERGENTARFRVHAHGDLDGDSVESTISIDGAFVPPGPVKLSPLDVQNEIE